MNLLWNMMAQATGTAGGAGAGAGVQTIIVQPSPEAEWKFWLVFVMCLITGIFMPAIAGTLRSILGRLKDGDSKFDSHGNRITVVETNQLNLASVCAKLTTSVDKLSEKLNDMSLEGQGAIEAARREMIKEFATKEELAKLEQKLDDNHLETMRGIHALQRH